MVTRRKKGLLKRFVIILVVLFAATAVVSIVFILYIEPIWLSNDMGRIGGMCSYFQRYLDENGDMPFDKKGPEYALYKLYYLTSLDNLFYIPSNISRFNENKVCFDHRLKKVVNPQYRYINKSLKDISEGDIVLIEDPRYKPRYRKYIFVLIYTHKKSENLLFHLQSYYGFDTIEEAEGILGKNISSVDQNKIGSL